MNGGKNWVNTGLINSDVAALLIGPVTSATLYAGTDGSVCTGRDRSGAGSFDPARDMVDRRLDGELWSGAAAGGRERHPLDDVR